MFPYFLLYGDWSLAALRVVLGLVFVVHGWPKIKSLKTTAANFGGMGFKPGIFWGPLVAVVEFFGGLALILGFWTQVAALLSAGEFAVIVIWKLSKRQSFVGGYEFDLVLLAAALVVLTQGSGAWSLDRFWYGGF